MWAKAGLGCCYPFCVKRWPEGISSAPSFFALESHTDCVVQVDVRELCTMHPRTNWPKDRNNTRAFDKTKWVLLPSVIKKQSFNISNLVLQMK